MKFRVQKRWQLLSLATLPFYGFANEVVFIAQGEGKPLWLTQFSDGDPATDVKVIAPEEDHSQHMQTDPGIEQTQQSAHMQHGHDAGMLMFEYRFMRMYQQGLLQGTKSVAPEAVLQDAQDTARWVDANGEPIMSIGTEMTMDMHMFMVMYSMTDKLTLTAMTNYLVNDMSMLMRPMDDMGPGHTMPMATITDWSGMFMESAGIGDTQVGMTYKLDDYLLFDPLLTVSVSLPTGSIDQADTTGVLPYDMQLGSGSYDLLVGYGMGNMWNSWHVGTEAKYLWRTCDNEQGYRLGDRYSIEGYVKYHLKTNTTLRSSVKHEDWGKIRGRDDRIDDNPNYYGGMRTDLWIGASQTLPFGFALDFHYGLPLHQKLNEVQMQTDWQMQVGISWMWM